jgi:hypothetical protein
MLTRQDMLALQFFDRLDRLYRDQLDGRDRELHLKDRLITELERRAQQAEANEAALRHYIENLTPSNDYQPPEKNKSRRWWSPWR